MFKKFPHYLQYDDMDCGPACLRIICRYYGKSFSLESLRSLTHTTRAGSTLLGLSDAAEEIGIRTIGYRLNFEDLATEAPFPCIAYWQQRHFVVIYKIRRNKVYVSDPGYGLIRYTREEFLKGWSAGTGEGIILTVDPAAAFYDKEEDAAGQAPSGVQFIWTHLLRYRKLLVQLLAGVLAASLIQLAFPFITRSIVDTGIQHNDLGFVYLMLFAQLLLFLGKISVELLRGYILTHLSSRINISLLSDFFFKLMRLPLGFFDIKMTGDILQRINDHQRVESFLTSGTINILFSSLSLVIFSIVLVIYNPLIFVVFAVGSIFYFGWVTLFIRKNAILDYKQFSQLAQNQEKNLELIYGMQEIKLHNAGRQKRWQWEHLQVKLFKINLRSLSLKQAQTGGASIINELKNIIVSFLAARLVMNGRISLGVMLSISYIIGQLNAPLLQLVEFMQSWQNARLSIARINEIHKKPDEETVAGGKQEDIPQGDIHLENLSFRYEGGVADVLKNISLCIPHQKITAIVGASGSGKTTLLKLLLKFYEPEDGTIRIRKTALSEISHHAWRENCGAVMQDGYIFNDTILSNIAVGEDRIDRVRVKDAAQIASIDEFISDLPLAYDTKIGQNGMGLSAGQKQRILIARAVYKNPDILLFDEATSALDARNEKIIIENLNRFFRGKTVIVIAHRLSTVKSADKIVVLEKGEITEEGTHESLLRTRSGYFDLVRNQLELGN
jgi:ATP-binding cassette subfamily B protein